MRTLRVVPVLAVLALCLSAPAMADLTFTFTSGATFQGTYEQGDTTNSLRACTPNGSDATSILNFQCTPYPLSGYGSQTMTLGQTMYYYLGSLTDYETDNNISGGNNEGTSTSTPLRITFDTSVTSPFVMDLPVTVSTGADTVLVSAAGLTWIQGVGVPDEYLFAQVRLSSTQDTTPNPPPALSTSYTYNIGASN
jgi:hypothetical protein